MNAPVNEQIKAEAAKSLLERLAEKTKLATLFRRNAAMKHGVPFGDEREIEITPNECATQEPQPEPSQNVVQIVKTDGDNDDRIARLEQELEKARQPVDTAQAPQTTTMSDKVKGILQTLAAVGALGVAVWGGSQFIGDDDKGNDKQQQVMPYYESPYQYLEDEGEHLP